MAQKTNSFERFWKELKRRKVVHVITVYAAVSFVILQLVDIVVQPLHLPDWTLALVIVLLCIGFVISIFVSWVYDITPQGVKKTKSFREVKHADKINPVTSSGWKIATFMSIVVMVALVVINILTRRSLAEDRLGSENSIAVLPFNLLSEDTNKQYIADGIMNAIILNLSKIKDLRVMPAISVEQYRDTKKTAHLIGKELDVKYLLYGNFQKSGENVKLIVQLVKANKESNGWGNEYNRNWKDIFTVQSEVAQIIATELHTIITPEEKKLIRKIPTTNLTAYDLYLKANSYLKVYEKTHDLSSYHTSVNLYKEALEIDSTFARAYTGLAIAYYNRFYYENYIKENFLDSCFNLANKALSFDDQLDEAYYIRGKYYQENGRSEEASNDFNKALKINPNYYSAYVAEGGWFANSGIWNSADFVKSIDNYNKALARINGDDRPALLRNLGFVYLDVGFIEKAKQLYKEALALDGDSAKYFDNLYFKELSIEDFEKSIFFGEKASKFDSTYIPDLTVYSIAGQHQKAYLAAKKEVEKSNKSGILPISFYHRIGYAFYKAGKRKEAEYYFNEQIRYSEKSIRLGRDNAKWKSPSYDLAATYAFLGDTAKAYQYLDDFSKMNTYPLWWISYIKHDPLFNSIRREERFQKIQHNVESKYQAEHERVKKWLEEQGQL